MRCAEGGVSPATGARLLHGFLIRGITLRSQALAHALSRGR